MATLETNQMRRAHRVNIPLTVIVNKEAYTTKDWSMTGVGLIDLPLELEFNEIIDAHLIVTLEDARIEMPVQLQFKVKRENISGFEFHKISEKNKRVLREFLELSIEGKLDQVDGLISIYNEPIIDTPIKESVVLSDEEETYLKKAFDKRAKLYIQFGVAFFILLILTIYYNTTYIYRSIGIVSGNFVKISPSTSGKIVQVYVKIGDRIQKNSLLFELDNTEILNKISIINAKLHNLKHSLQRKNTPQSYEVLNLLQKDFKKKKQAYRSAQELYKKRYITKHDLENSYSLYTKSKLKYLAEKNKIAILGSSSAIESNLITLITKLELDKENLLNQLNYIRIFSSAEGTLYTLKAEVGNYIHAGDETMVIETDAPSYVVCKVKQDESLKIYKGMEVKVYSQAKDRTFAAHVETIGNLSLNTQSQITNEVSLKEITVKIVFEDTNLKLPLNERVKVWFYRPLF